MCCQQPPPPVILVCLCVCSVNWLACHDDHANYTWPDSGEYASIMLNISAQFAEVPLEVLLGHKCKFCSFVVMVICVSCGGANVGVQGVVEWLHT